MGQQLVFFVIVENRRTRLLDDSAIVGSVIQIPQK